MRFDFFAPARVETRHTPQTAELDMPFVVACTALFDAGCDTADIASRLCERECAVATALRLGLEARRTAT